MAGARTIFAQLTDFLPKKKFDALVSKYQANKGVINFTCWEQYLCMLFAQLTHRRSLRSTESCLAAHQTSLYHVGIKSKVAKSTLGYANSKRPWELYQEYAVFLINQARKLYIDDPLFSDLNNALYALDSSVVDLCLTLFPWAKFRKTKAGIKLHTVYDIQTNMPIIIDISDAKGHDAKFLDKLIIELGATYIMDRAYFDFARLFRIHQERASFIVRAKKKFKYYIVDYRKVDKETGLRSDQTISLVTSTSKEKYPDRLRRVSFYDEENKKLLVFITNNFTLPALTIAELYKARWQIELFFKWIKQHLKIQAFFGTSANAVKTQIWIAISAYALVAIIKKKIKIELSLYNVLEVLSCSLFVKKPILSVFSDATTQKNLESSCNQLEFF